jgi:hypothetical protein
MTPLIDGCPRQDIQALRPTLGASRGQFLRRSEAVSSAGLALEGVRHPQQSQDPPLQSCQLRGELDGRSLA